MVKTTDFDSVDVGSIPAPSAIFLLQQNGESIVSLAERWMVVAVKVKCHRARSEGWSPRKLYFI